MTALLVPELDCPPLSLRPPLREDIASLASILRADPTRYYGERLTFENSFSKVHQAIADWVAARLGFWVIIFESRAIGMLGFGCSSGISDMEELPELEIVLATEFEKRGFATVACNVAIKWLSKAQQTKAVSYCVDANKVSAAHALARRLGGTEIDLNENFKPLFPGDVVTTTDTWYRIEVPA